MRNPFVAAAMAAAMLASQARIRMIESFKNPLRERNMDAPVRRINTPTNWKAKLAVLRPGMQSNGKREMARRVRQMERSRYA